MSSVSLKINGKEVSASIPDNTILTDFLRENLGLTGTHVGCDTSQCGACVVHVDGVSVKSCTMLAVQADGKEITTIEGIGDGDNLHPMQEAFKEHHGLQCGFCTPGMIMSAIEFITENKNPSEVEIREALEGNICRCTGYHNIVKSVQAAAEKMGA
ncbi:MAG: (2Fe-2S)-binding protein [Paracoccaceae bacterium]|jgi:carbon-monoxide dehydrogenase small subunit|tara:strand:+ start:1322 stop:1789 length:468 start_codon:yes stop_codon:yes gene_type:complete